MKKNRKKHKKKHYRILPLIILGIIIIFLIQALGTLIYGSLAYFANWNIEEAFIGPMFVFALAIFLSSAVINFIIKGQSFTPVFALIIAYTIINIFIVILQTGLASLSWSGLFIKLFVALLIGFLTFLPFSSLLRSQKTTRTRSGSRGKDPYKKLNDDIKFRSKKNY